MQRKWFWRYSWNFTVLFELSLFIIYWRFMFYVLCTFQKISSLFSIYCLWPYLSLYVRRLRNNSCDNLEPIWEYKRHKRWWYIKETVVGISYLDLNIHITQAMKKIFPLLISIRDPENAQMSQIIGLYEVTYNTL